MENHTNVKLNYHPLNLTDLSGRENLPSLNVIQQQQINTEKLSSLIYGSVQELQLTAAHHNTGDENKSRATFYFQLCKQFVLFFVVILLLNFGCLRSRLMAPLNVVITSWQTSVSKGHSRISREVEAMTFSLRTNVHSYSPTITPTQPI